MKNPSKSTPVTTTPANALESLKDFAKPLSTDEAEATVGGAASTSGRTQSALDLGATARTGTGKPDDSI